MEVQCAKSIATPAPHNATSRAHSSATPFSHPAKGFLLGSVRVKVGQGSGFHTMAELISYLDRNVV